MRDFNTFLAETAMIGQPADPAVSGGLGSRIADRQKKLGQLQFISQRLGTQVKPGQVFRMNDFVHKVGVDNVRALLQAGVIQIGDGEYKIL